MSSNEKLCYGCYKTFYGLHCPCGSFAKSSELFDRTKYGRVEMSQVERLAGAQRNADNAYAQLKSFNIRYNKDIWLKQNNHLFQ